MSAVHKETEDVQVFCRNALILPDRYWNREIIESN